LLRIGDLPTANANPVQVGFQPARREAA
jgi:hypothetical protein